MVLLMRVVKSTSIILLFFFLYNLGESQTYGEAQTNLLGEVQPTYRPFIRNCALAVSGIYQQGNH